MQIISTSLNPAFLTLALIALRICLCTKVLRQSTGMSYVDTSPKALASVSNYVAFDTLMQCVIIAT